jgi:hypothetical protein
MDSPDGDSVPARDEDGQDPGGTDTDRPQSAALRRQQRYVGIGVSLVAGGALAAIAFQQFTDSPVLVALAGLAGTALVFWLVRTSVLPGDPQAEQ